MLIIGAGATGLATAIAVARRGTRVTLLEQNRKIAKKILASGNGKCNISNRYISPDKYHSSNPKFADELLSGYGYDEIKEFFLSMGLSLTGGCDGKLFPMSMQASSVVELLEYEAIKLGVEILCESKVISVDRVGSGFQVNTATKKYSSTHLLISAGSIAAPKLGGSDSGYMLATNLGHSLIKRHPSLVQLCSDEEWVKECAGVKIYSEVKLYANGEYIKSMSGDVLFANYGISGLAILDISREVSIRLASYDYCELSIDLMPKYSKEKLTSLLQGMLDASSQKPIHLWLQGVINKKIIPIILKQAKSKAKTEKEINRKEINRIVHSIKNLKLSINDTRGWDGAEVATGGIDTTEIDSQTLKSKIVPNLYLGGEILDIDGDRGGYNFHSAWVCALRIGVYMEKGKDE